MGADDGATAQPIKFDRAVFMSIAAFTAVAWYNVIELNVQVFLTFKRHRGLYFWSLLISSYGCVLHSLGFLMKFFQLTTNEVLSVTIITIGWYCMVTGQAIVLYSRLHLVVREQKVLRGVLAMIIVDAFCFHIPTTVLTYGSNSNRPLDFIGPFNVVERLQMTAFCIQEFIISGIYVYATIKLLRPVYHGRTRKVMMQLIWINSIIIAMDVVLLGMEYSSYYEIEATIKAMVYSIKLKLEFAVLNQLMTLANSSVNNAQNLNIPDAEAQVPPKARKGRSKSLDYLSRFHYPRLSNKPPKPPPKSPSTEKKFQSPSKYTLSNHDNYSSFSGHNRGHLKWVPSLDRKCVFDTEHIEHANDPLNVFTNPAACWRPGRTHPEGFPPHDGLGGIPGEPTSPLSPTLTGSTLDPLSSPVHLRRPTPDLHLDLQPREQLPSGVLRSTRPSVSDWAHGPDSETSPGSDEVQLNPYDNVRLASPQSPGSVRAGRGMAERTMGMDFMTSALRE